MPICWAHVPTSVKQTLKSQVLRIKKIECFAGLTKWSRCLFDRYAYMGVRFWWAIIAHVMRRQNKAPAKGAHLGAKLWGVSLSWRTVPRTQATPPHNLSQFTTIVTLIIYTGQNKSPRITFTRKYHMLIVFGWKPSKSINSRLWSNGELSHCNNIQEKLWSNLKKTQTII